MKKLVFLLFSAILLFGCGGQQQNQNAKNDQPVVQDVAVQEVPPVYVLSDEFGEKFLLLAYLGDDETPRIPDSLSSYKYIIYNGRYYPVTLEGFQFEDEENNNYRETFFNFDNLSGYLFKMQSGKLLENPVDEFDAVWDAPLLVDEKFKTENTVYPLSNYENGRRMISDMPEAQKKAFEERYNRKIIHGWCNAVFGENNAYQFVNMQFKNKGDEALGVSALVKNDEILAVIEDYAVWNEESVWRVDDGGEFGGMSIDLVTEKDGVLTIYTADSGPEGTFYQNYHLIDGVFYGGTVYASFYQAPY